MVGPRNAAFAEESAEVELLLASLNKLNGLTKRIKSSMGRLDVSGGIVREAIGLIYSNTQQLQVTNRNIDRINEQIEKLRQPLDAKGREEGIIRAGPEKAGLQAYLAALKRVDRALTDLSSSNLRSNQQATSDFYHLLLTGITQIQDQYRTLLEEDAATLEPLHYITKQMAFPTLPQDKVARLGQLAEAISSASVHSSRFDLGQDDVAARIYAEVRGPYIDHSLRNLSTASLSTAKRKTADASIYRQGSNGVNAYASSIEGMILAEHGNVTRIFPPEAAARTLTNTCSEAMFNFQKTLKELNNMIKPRIMYDFPLAYEIIDMITPLSYRLEARSGQFRTQFSDALRPVRETSRSSLGELIEETRTQANSISSLPPDGASIPLVSETASRLYALANFERPVAALLSSLGDGGWRRTSSNLTAPSASTLNLELTPSNENPNLLSHYLLDLVDALFSSLSTKAAQLHRTKPLQGIFLLNAHAVLRRTIQSTSDLSRYLLITPHSTKLDSYHKTASKLYLTAWNEPSQHLLDTISTSTSTVPKESKNSNNPRLSGSAVDSSALIKSLSSKDKDKLKDKFRQFNASFDDLVIRHKSLTMEKEVRAAMAKEITSMIEPLYARFYDRYHEIDKGKGKVVKYSKPELAGVLQGLA